MNCRLVTVYNGCRYVLGGGGFLATRKQLSDAPVLGDLMVLRLAPALVD